MSSFIALSFAAFGTIFSLILCYSKLSGEKLKYNFKTVFLAIIGSLISSCLLYFNLAIIRNIFTISFMIFFIKSKSLKGILELFYYTVIIWIYGIFVDLIVMVIVSLLNLTNVFELLHVQIIFSYIMAITLFGFCSISFVKNITRKTINKLLKVKPYILLDIIFILSIMYLSSLCLADLKNTSLVALYFIIAIVISYIIYMTIDKHYNIKRLKELNKILLKNIDFFISLDEEHRIFKHNLTHQLSGIKSVSTKKGKDLIDDLILEYNKNFAMPKNIKNIPEGINGIVYEKFYNFNSKDIKLIVNNNISTLLLDNMRPKTFNRLCEALGVCLDNSMEATIKSDEKLILIDFEENREFYFIDIKNTFSNKVDIDCFGDKNYSTKEGIRGIGIFSILKRKEFEIKNKIVNNCFCTTIQIKKINY